MIVTFYGKNFNGLQDNASLVVGNGSYSLVRRGVEMDELKCTCEAFTAEIQPTFVVVKNDRGNYVYGALAGIPQLDKNNQTKVTASDLKTMLKSDVLLNFSNFSTEQSNLKEFFQTVFDAWNEQVNQNSINCELIFDDGVEAIQWRDMKPTGERVARYDAWEDLLAPYLKYYALFMTTKIELSERKVIFNIGCSMKERSSLTLKLWELGIYDYGKWIANVNETQGYVLNTQTNELITMGSDGKIKRRSGIKRETEEEKWILTEDNSITSNEKLRSIYPIKRKMIVKETDDSLKESELLDEARMEALKELTDSMFKENLEISNEDFLQRFQTKRGGGIVASNEREEQKVKEIFETRFCIYTKQNGEKTLYKELPCGEIHYNENGIKKIQIGYRFTGLQFII